jgi:hypothetical protein
MSRQLCRSAPRPAHRRARVLLILFALAVLLMTTQAGAATVASQRAVTNFTFGFGWRTIPGHRNELYLRQAVIGNVGGNESVYIRCHNCAHGKFTKAKIRGRLVSFGTNPAPLMTARSIFYIATSAPGKIGIVKAFAVRPAPIYLAEAGYECTPPGVSAQQGAQNPFGVAKVDCPPELVPPPLQLLIPYKGHTYSAGKPIDVYVEVTGVIPTDRYFWAGVESNNNGARKCTSFNDTRHIYGKTFGTILHFSLNPKTGINSNHLRQGVGRGHWCTGPARAFIFSDTNSDPGVTFAHEYGARLINIR